MSNSNAADALPHEGLEPFDIAYPQKPMLLLFFRFEFEQVRLSRIFGARAQRLEGSFRRIDRGQGRRMGAQIPVPRRRMKSCSRSSNKDSSDGTHGEGLKSETDFLKKTCKLVAYHQAS